MALNPDAIGEKIGPLKKAYTWKDTVLYALGVGAGFDELDYVYEDRQKVIPSFSIAGIFDFLAETAIKANVNLSGILHGEQDIIFHGAIPPEGTLITTGAITHMYDKGQKKGALVVSEADTFHSNGQKLYTSIFTLFCRKDGGFGGESGPDETFEIPQREPDFSEHAIPPDNQPLLYRLSGDIFALHVDPEFAKASGFEKPIMHGLCTHGYACRAVIKHLFPGQPERMKRFKVRFSNTLYPGVPIKTHIWKINENKAVFRTITAENEEIILDLGIVEWIGPDELAFREQLGSIHFKGQVAVVTGAGAGLGKVYAMELAQRGAKVLVNDLGGGTDGSGGSSSAADEVVKAIQRRGGEAVANYDSVATKEGGAAIIKQAVDAWGRVDILINNAGILKDKSFIKMDPAMWQDVLDVHLNGAYHLSRPALNQMKQQNYGRIIFTSSAAGLYGNFGQTNYGAAKLALIGFMNTLKIEGMKADIKVNTVAPIAGTRLTRDILPPDLFDKLKPEFVAPLVLYLASEQCPVTGGIYNAGMGYYNRVSVFTGKGLALGDDTALLQPETIAKKMESIQSMAGAKPYFDAVGALSPMLEALDPQKNKPDTNEPTEAQITVKHIFKTLPEVFDPEVAKGLDLVFQFTISGPEGGEWYSIIKNQTCKVKTGKFDTPTTTIKMGDVDFLALMSGNLNPMAAYTSGN